MEPNQVFLEYVLKAIVEYPEEVKIERTTDDMGVFLRVWVHKSDMAKVIGRKGLTAKSIRTILRTVGMRNNARINLKFEEPEGSHSDHGMVEKTRAQEVFGPILENLNVE